MITHILQCNCSNNSDDRDYENLNGTVALNLFKVNTMKRYY